MKTKIIIFFWILLQTCKLSGQTSGGFEPNVYLLSTGKAEIVPKVFYETPKWYGEAKYNYDDRQTLSFAGGKIFSHEGHIDYEIIPLAGFDVGLFAGPTIGVKSYLSMKKLRLSTESVSGMSIRKSSNHFFYNWSDAGYQFNEHLYAGMALQISTTLSQRVQLEPGICFELTVQRWSFPVYLFNIDKPNRCVVVGLTYLKPIFAGRPGNPDRIPKVMPIKKIL